MKKNNAIPRKFNRITCKMLIETSESKPGDMFHVYHNDSVLCALNTATGKYCYMFPSLLRDSNLCEFLEVI